MIAGVAAFIFLYSGDLSSRLETEQGYPAGAVSFLRSHGLRGNLLADFGWGEYLIWHAPESRIYIDGRYDTVFSDKVISDYLKFFFNEHKAETVLAEYPHDFILLAPDAPIVKKLESRNNWKLLYRDKDAVLFARSGITAGSGSSSIATSPTPKHQYFP